MMRSVITFHWGKLDEHGNHERAYQWHNPPHVPRAGEVVDLWTVRDQDGRYAENRHLCKGKVDRVEYTIQERGTGRNDREVAMYVDVYVEEAQTAGRGPGKE